MFKVVSESHFELWQLTDFDPELVIAQEDQEAKKPVPKPVPNSCRPPLDYQSRKRKRGSQLETPPPSSPVESDWDLADSEESDSELVGPPPKRARPAESLPKRGRGRPPKPKPVNPAPKRPRGRPRKIKVRNTPEPIIWETAGDLDDSIDLTGDFHFPAMPTPNN
jgi:hypothetical protein